MAAEDHDAPPLESQLVDTDPQQSSLTEAGLASLPLEPSATQRKNEKKNPPGNKQKLPKISRREAVAAKRKEFAHGLFNQDLADLASWHRFRSPAEQKRFLKSVDSVYEAWAQAGEQKFGAGGGPGPGLTLADIPEDQVIPAALLPGGRGDAEGDRAEKLMDTDVSKAIVMGAELDGGERKGRRGLFIPGLRLVRSCSGGSSF